jgi:hypothetical protein
MMSPSPFNHTPPGYAMHPGHPGYRPSAPPEKTRNVALIVVGVALLLFAALAAAVFAFNLYQYLTVADRWARDPMLGSYARGFGVRLVQAAAMRRMEIFGPVSFALGAGGLLLGGLGLRKT